MWKKNKVTIGIDLGATKIAIGVVDADGALLTHKLAPTEQDPNELIEQLSVLIEDAIESAEGKPVDGIGLASAGPLNIKTGNLINPSNFPQMKVFPIVERLEAELLKQGVQQKVYFQNDAMAAALGEGWVGGAQNLNTYAVITVGTGIGTGVIFDGKPLQNMGMGGEFGIQLIDYNGIKRKGTKDIKSQSIEGIASGTAIVKRARRKGFRGNSIQELVSRIEEEGVEKYKSLFDDAALALAMLCYNLSLGINPDKILFTGGVMHARKYFLSELREHYKELTNNQLAFRTPLALAKLSYKAGVIGAAKLPLISK